VTTSSRSRLRRTRDGDRGVYAILYAVLVVVLVGMSAIVVDIAGLREDRRDNRAAADSAATGGAEFLNPISFGGVRPKEGCEQAWAYLSSILDDLPTPSTPCSDFNGVTATTYCSTAAPAMIRAQRTVGDRTVVIAWPVPRDDPATAADESQGYLNSDVAPNPGGVVNQDFASERDGSDAGCDRIGVAIIEDRTFGLANGIGSGGQNTSIHSVARFNPDGGEADQIAALNVLNPTECASLVTTGGGKVLVGPTVENGVIAGPGIIAVESTGLGTCVGSPNPDGTGGGNRVIDPNRT
jgi:hypothetical protein